MKQSSSTIYQILQYPLQQGKESRLPKNMLLITDNTKFCLARSKEMDAKDSAGCWSWLIQKENSQKHIAKESRDKRGNMTAKKCERKLIEFEGKLVSYCSSKRAEETTQDKWGQDKHNPKWVIKYDVLLSLEYSSGQHSSEEITNSANMSSISCCRLVAKLCHYTFSGSRISFVQTKVQTGSVK